LLMDRSAFESLLEQSVRNILRNGVLKYSARSNTAGDSRDLAENVNNRSMNALLFLEREIFILQENGDRRQDAVFRHAHEVGAESERKKVVRQFGRHDRFEIFEFDLGWLENVR